MIHPQKTDSPYFLFSRYDNSETLNEFLYFSSPVKIIACHTAETINNCFIELENALDSGYFAAGFLSYEAGYHFANINHQKKTAFPLLYFGIFKKPLTISLSALNKLRNNAAIKITSGYYSLPLKKYINDLSKIKHHLQKGNSYQVNYTFKYKFNCAVPSTLNDLNKKHSHIHHGSSALINLFLTLLERQTVPYAVMGEFEDWAILSLSPELFFQKTGKQLFTRPMKGTKSRGITPREDAFNKQFLYSDEKNRAENIMIVDLLRNDLGKISLSGSVKTDKIFSVEEYDTLFQMTSDITSTLKKNINFYKIFQALFPSGSVTGAPKKRTLDIIRSLEKEERNIYTGCIGYISPKKNCLFNIAIRTALINKTSGHGELGIGSGVVFDSIPKKEYEESLLKSSFFVNLPAIKLFSIIETILWENRRYFLLTLHMERLKKTCAFFGYPYDSAKVLKNLKLLSKNFYAEKKYKIRLLIDKQGNMDLSYTPLEKPATSPVKILLSKKTVQSDNIFLHYKTTNRDLYDKELSRHKKNGFFDVLFLNERGELTEGAISNIVLKLNNKFFTPPVSSGLLNGVYRQVLLKHKTRPHVEEKILYLEDIRNASDILLINSVRKITKAILQ
ncbi:para-aminobenzoate synthase subunit I [Candidatus Omnitrophus magneticus]|uniref:Para-aminobenzoate synthase subunit I n=1 Tax=Candidatus Omnitrophus magneticus TaxID=1609969 RepID=A0A0F0CS35_9BACT|nr:para-aminobenzoate synthase subunit I [Candidatus Omnitrophus magneticus]